MRIVLQKVKQASVTVDGAIVNAIQHGYCLLVGICQTDDASDVDYLASKVLSLRLFEKEDKAWKCNIQDVNGEILSISQFTLYAQTRKGAKPDFHLAKKAAESRGLYNSFVEKLGAGYQLEKIKDGVFGAMMDVSLVNDGPVTIILDSNK